MEFLVSIHITLFSMSSTIKGYIAFVRVAQEKGARDGKLRNASANVSVRVLKIVAAIIDALLILLTAVSYQHLRAHETKANLVCRLLLDKKKKRTTN